MSDEQRLEDLEVRLAYQEDSLASLEKLIVKQGEQIAMLERANKTLYQRLNSLLEHLEERSHGNGEEPPPPHY